MRPKYVWYDRTGDTSNRFRLPENSALYEARAGIRLGGIPPELYPAAALELSLWHGVGYRESAGRYGFAEQPQETKHLTQRTWARLGGTYTFWGSQAAAYLNAGIAEDTDALSAFRMGGGLPMRTRRDRPDASGESRCAPTRQNAPAEPVIVESASDRPNRQIVTPSGAVSCANSSCASWPLNAKP